MNKNSLGDAVFYSKERAKSDLLDKKTYISTDNLKQNKLGKEIATGLPPKGNSFPHYSERDILIANIRPYLKKIWFAENEGLHSSDVLNLKVQDGFDPKFIYYNCLQNQFFDHMMKGAKGSKMPRGDKDQILDFPIPDYDIEKQKQIAKVLSELDAKIELNNQINTELEAMAKLVYDYWFVQFDFPISAAYAAAVGKPELEGKPYKSYGGQLVYNEVLKREIPEGWEVKKLIDLCSKIGDGIHGTPKYVVDSDYSFINGNNLKNGFIRIDGETKKVSVEEYRKHQKELDDNSILMSINGTLGNLAVYNGEKVMLGKSSAYINCLENFRSYCYEYLSQNHMHKLFWNIATGSTIKNLSLNSIKNLKILFPGLILIKEYAQITKPLIAKRKNIFIENQELARLRDWLLPMLMNGQVTVNSNEKSKLKTEGAAGSSYKMDNEELGMVAEDNETYNSNQGLEDLFPTINYDYELAAVVLLTERRFRRNYGRKYLQKMFSNMQFLVSLPKIEKLTFEELPWGMFSKGLAQSIENEVFIEPKPLENGRKGYSVKSISKKEVEDWIRANDNQDFVKSVKEMLGIYEEPLINKEMNRIELLNTVLECIKVLNTYEFPKIYAKMKTWKMEEAPYNFKADKFKPEETMHMVALIKKIKI